MAVDVILKNAGGASVTYEGINTVRLNISGGTADFSLDGAGYRIVAYTETGSTVTATLNGVTYTGEEDEEEPGTYVISVQSPGTYYVLAENGDLSASANVTVSEVETNLYYPPQGTKVFGVVWDYSSSSTALTRLTAETDPLGVVNTDVTSEPTPGVGGVTGSSFFDDYAPWSGMEEYNVINNAVSYKQGESGFSRTSYDTVVYIPAFYYRVVDDSTNSKRYFYVSNGAIAGFEQHPGSGRYIARYQTNTGYVSKSGMTTLASITRTAARTGSTGKGTGWYQQDYMTWCAVWLLYLVEYADWNGQTKIGQGYTNGNSSRVNSGKTDSMVYHTGREDGTDGKTCVQYRHIENPWGNVLQWVDGINFYNNAVYLCDDPANYADDTYDNYSATGTTLTASMGGYIKAATYNSSYPWACLPSSTSGGSSTTYIPDYAYSASATGGWKALYVGGHYSSGLDAGLWYFYASNAASYSRANLGSRLLFIP